MKFALWKTSYYTKASQNEEINSLKFVTREHVKVDRSEANLSFGGKRFYVVDCTCSTSYYSYCIEEWHM